MEEQICYLGDQTMIKEEITKLWWSCQNSSLPIEGQYPTFLMNPPNKMKE